MIINQGEAWAVASAVALLPSDKFAAPPTPASTSIPALNPNRPDWGSNAISEATPPPKIPYPRAEPLNPSEGTEQYMLIVVSTNSHRRPLP